MNNSGDGVDGLVKMSGGSSKVHRVHCEWKCQTMEQYRVLTHCLDTGWLGPGSGLTTDRSIHYSSRPEQLASRFDDVDEGIQSGMEERGLQIQMGQMLHVGLGPS